MRKTRFYFAALLLVIGTMATAFYNSEQVSAGPSKPQPIWSNFELAADLSGANPGNTTEEFSTTYDGRYILMVSSLSNLAQSDTNGKWDVFLYDTVNDSYEIVSLNDDDTQITTDARTDGRSSYMSSDGRFVVFTTIPSSSTKYQLYLRDRQNGTTTLVSTDSNGTMGNEHSFVHGVSDDGRYVLFDSASTNLDSGGIASSQAFLKDMQTGNVEKIVYSGDAHDWRLNSAHLSADGTTIAVLAYDLTANNRPTKAVVIDRASNVGTIVSDPSGADANQAVSYALLSRNGNFAAFYSSATNLVTQDQYKGRLYLYDMDTAVLESIDGSPTSSPNGGSHLNKGASPISDDGRYIGHLGSATNLDGFSGYANPANLIERKYSLWVKDRVTNTNHMMGNQLVQLDSDFRNAVYSPQQHSFYFYSFEGVLDSDTSGSDMDIYKAVVELSDNAAIYTHINNPTAKNNGFTYMTDNAAYKIKVASGVNFTNAAVPQISPDRTKVFYTGGPDSTMHSMRADGSGKIDLGYEIAQYSLSLDGQKVVTVGDMAISEVDHDYYPTIKTMDIDGQNATTIALPEVGYPSHITWSNDGQKIYFQFRQKNVNQEWDDCQTWIASIDIDGSDFTKLTPNDCLRDANPAVDPVNGKIAWNSEPGKIRIMNADGTNNSPLSPVVGTNITYLGRPTWSPDGTKIASAYKDTSSVNQKLAIINATTGAVLVTSTNATQVTYSDWASTTP